MSPLKSAARRYLLDDQRPALRRVGRQLVRVRRRMNRIDDHGRPQYRHCIVEGAKLAAALGYERVTAVEFGVATGQGLIALERIAQEVERHWPVHIDVVGFDLGTGLPAPTDYRDLPWHWAGGDFPMDEAALRARLERAELVIGNLAETLPRFMGEDTRLLAAPLSAVLFDLDLYSSTAEALKLLAGPAGYHLPRVQTYFDDLGRTNEYIGEWLAVNEFNARHGDRKIVFRFDRMADPRMRQVLEFHHFDHPRYCENPRTAPRHIGRSRKLI